MEKLFKQEICGNSLQEFYSQYYIRSILQSSLSFEASGATQKIISRFGKRPSLDGFDNSGIVDIRDTLFNLRLEEEDIQKILILAPHTHWDINLPIIYTYDPLENKYIIGSHKVLQEEFYLPVSFIFHERMPIPIEWIDRSVNIDKFEWGKAMEVVYSLNKKIWKKDYPFGIELNFKFKEKLSSEFVPAVELPINKSDRFSGFSCVRPALEEVQSQENIIQHTEQVTWHPFSDLGLEFSEEEIEILQLLRAEMNKEKDETKRRILLSELS